MGRLPPGPDRLSRSRPGPRQPGGRGTRARNPEAALRALRKADPRTLRRLSDQWHQGANAVRGPVARASERRRHRADRRASSADRAPLPPDAGDRAPRPRAGAGDLHGPGLQTAPQRPLRALQSAGASLRRTSGRGGPECQDRGEPAGQRRYPGHRPGEPADRGEQPAHPPRPVPAHAARRSGRTRPPGRPGGTSSSATVTDRPGRARSPSSSRRLSRLTLLRPPW